MAGRGETRAVGTAAWHEHCLSYEGLGRRGCRGWDAAISRGPVHMSETTFSHQKANSPDANYSDGGLRSFFVYRDTGVNAATKGKVRVQLVRAAYKSSEAKGGTGFHFHAADAHVVFMVRGGARFDYDGIDTLIEAGDCVHQPPGMGT